MEHGLEKRFPTNPKDYKFYEEVGEGVSATVYRALCIPLNQIVGIKVLDLEKCSNDLDGIRREVQTMSLIDHPNTLRAYCSFTVGYNLWVVMPYLAGGSALHIMKYAYPEGFEEPVIATLLYEVLKALAYLHAQGHIHRDVKAGNILIDAKGAVKLADFGVSASMFDTGDRQRARNTFVGTPCWMAPEVMQQLHGYDFKADIWSFGITALELAHGHAPFSKYPPMKVLLMTLQNAPPGLDYERDKRFSKSFKEMLAACLVKDPKRRPTSEKLLKHPFFKHACSNEYSIQTILEGLSPLGERFKELKGRETNILLQHKGASNELEQQEYMRGISGWNFNLEDLKSQAALICSLDDVHCSENIEVNTNLKKGYGNIGSSGLDEKDNFANNEDSREDLLQEMQDLEGPLASAFPSRPLEALKACFDVSEDMSATTSTQVIQSQLNTVTSQLQASVTKNYKFDMENGEAVENPSVSLNIDSHVCQKFSVDSLLFERILSPHGNVDTDTQRDCTKWSCQRERNHSGSLFHQIKDLPNVTSVVHDEPLERKVIQRKGRFQITFPNPTPKVSFSANLLTSAVNTAALIPSLKFLWHQNAMQKELLIKLINCLEQTSSTSGGNHTEVSDNNTGDSQVGRFSQFSNNNLFLKQLSLASGTERILQAHLTTLQNSVSRLSEEVQKLKLKNLYLKQQINSLSSARKDDKIVK